MPDPAVPDPRDPQDPQGAPSIAANGPLGQAPSPDDTTPIGVAPEGVSATGGQDAQAAGSKAGTSFETLLGRYVIDQGLATEDEVEHCRTLAKDVDDPAGRTLGDLLVEHEYVTARQLQRLRERLEAEKSGQQIPGYKILGKLGAGAMAKVYKARQLSLDREVAIKILPRKFAANPGFIERFYAEGRAAAALNHPNIVQAYDVGNVEDVYYFVMEYVDGGTVHDVILSHKRYEESRAIQVTIQIAEALDHAHGKGLIHRDVKPKNIMITKGGTVKLADMGLARAISDKDAAEAERGKAYGTPYYISPEQIRGEERIGPPADIYALGATLYHMVTGQVPFEGKTPQIVMSKHLKSELVPPDQINPRISAGLAEVIEMMMAKAVKKRYRTCRDLINDLRAVAAGERPPLAHKEILPDGALEALAAVEAQAASEIAQDTSLQRRGPAIEQVLSNPLFIVVAVLFLLSVIFNVLQVAGVIS